VETVLSEEAKQICFICGSSEPKKGKHLKNQTKRETKREQNSSKKKLQIDLAIDC